MIKKPIYTEFNLDAMSGNSRAIAVSHIDDTNTEVLEVCVRQGGSKIDLTGATVKARMVWHKEKTLVSDNVACTIDGGNVLIPFDNAAIQTHEGILKIEVNITRQRDVLTLQFPIYVRINDTILADAKVTPESQGTVPELLKEVKEELARVQGYVDEGRVFEIIDFILQGDPNIIPSLFVEKNEQDDYQLVYVDSEKEEKHVIFNFGNLPAAKGEKGDKGDKGDKGEKGERGTNGKDGTNGSDGFSPVATVTQTSTGATVSITDKSGTTTANIVNGTNGTNGTNGADGFSPTASVAKTGATATITITDKTGTTTASISDGAKGRDGTNGTDGFSPTATVSKSGTVSTITITDKNGTTTATVNDGAKGEQGERGAKGDKGDKGDTGAAGADWVPTAAEKTAIATEAAGMVSVPTKTSQLQNDSGFLTQHQDISGKANKATTLAGYGITNAYTKAQVDSAIQTAIGGVENGSY